jgi:hypothetical protein
MSEGIYTPPPPPASPPPAGPASPSYDFAKPFTFVFDDPRWVAKIVMGGVFYLLGFILIGFFFIFGYLARLARNVIAGAQYPLPEWDELGEYFGEGLRLFGVMLVWISPIVIIAVFFFVPAVIMSDTDNEVAQGLGGCATGAAWCLMFPLSLAVTFFMPAALLRAVVEQRFGAAFEFDQIWPFIKRNAGDYILAVVIYFVARFVGGLGIILLCIGVIFTGFWAMVITTHAFAQVWRRSLDRAAGRL